MSNSITVNSRKYDGSLSRSWQCEVVSRTQHAIVLKGVFDETVNHGDLGTIEQGTVSIEYFSELLWFNVFRFETPRGELRNYYANICIPAKVGDCNVDYVDLDIDVVVWPDGRVAVLDRDEFDRNISKYGYPDEMVEKVEATVNYLLELRSPSSWIEHFAA